MKHLITLCCFFLGSGAALLQAQPTLTGSWEGVLTVQGQEVAIPVHFAQTDADLQATIDIPQQGAQGLSLQAARYNEEEVVFTNGTVQLAGTLTWPKTEGPHPAVVLLTMGGPQTRDAESSGFKIFKVIADHLTQNGIAVLRYDDRGVGESTGSLNESTLTDFATDAQAAVALLKQRPEINPIQIGLLGHSQGGIVAPLAASESGYIAFVVLMGGPMLPGAQMALATQARLLQSRGATAEQIADSRAMQEVVFSAVRGEASWKTVEEALGKQLQEALAQASEAQLERIGDVEAFIKQRLEAQLAPVKSPLFASFLDYTPGETLASLTVPVLALFGELDPLVPTSLHKPATEKALEKAGVENTIHVFPAANHQFQTAKTGDPAEYATLEKAFIPGFLELVTQWIHEQTNE